MDGIGAVYPEPDNSNDYHAGAAMDEFDEGHVGGVGIRLTGATRT